MKKFSEFLPKTILADTDFLVGYNADGEYIRVPKSALLAGAATPATLTVQYSANGSSWHNSYTAGDHYMRTKAGSGSWSGAIPLCVSAYDIWRDRGNDGDEDEFLLSLKGEPGEPGDVSGLTIQDMSDYTVFLQQVNNAIANAKNALAAEVTQAVNTAIASTLANKLDKDLANIDAVTYMGDGAYIPIITQRGMVKVSTEDLAAYIGIKSRVENSSIETAIKSQRETMGGNTSTIDGITTYTLSQPYTLGTSAVYLNGNRLYAGRDYIEVNAYTIELIGWTPKSNDHILFEAIPLSASNPSQVIQSGNNEQ